MNFKLIGLSSLISYMFIILYQWIYANLNGYTFFMIGEPILIIKYLEWIAGIIGLFTAIYYFIEEIKK